MSFDLGLNEIEDAVAGGSVDWLWSAYQELQKERDEALRKLAKIKEISHKMQEQRIGYQEVAWALNELFPQ